MNENRPRPAPVIGLLAWEGGAGRALSSLENMPGNILHPDTFSFPIRLARIEGANYHTVVERPDSRVLDGMIAAARGMVADGIRAITTSCGFNAIFQRELADQVAVPVFTSSLLQVPLAQAMIGPGRKIGILTADRHSLSRAHLVNVGIEDPDSLAIAGMEDNSEFRRALREPDAEINTGLFIGEVVKIARHLKSAHPNLGALVLECTDLPPASTALRAETGLPVFDIITLVNMVYQSVAP